MSRSSTKPRRARASRDPLQVSLRWVVHLTLLLVVVPTSVLTGVGIVILWQSRNASQGLVMGILIVAFSASIVAGSLLLLILARRGARLAQVQETFMSRMSHELLTPLAGIRLHVQLLEGARLSDDAATSLEAIRRETGRLQELVEGIVSWRRVRSSRHLIHRAPTTLGAVVEAAVARTPGADRAKVRVAEPGQRIVADPAALGEAVGNLLQNALKYAGDDGPVELTARRLGRMAVFAVTDRGPGLPPTAPEQVYEPFVRYVHADRPDPGGSGLGLSIARQIVRAHGGKIAACRRLGRGLLFVIVVPAGGAA